MTGLQSPGEGKKRTDGCRLHPYVILLVFIVSLQILALNGCVISIPNKGLLHGSISCYVAIIAKVCLLYMNNQALLGSQILSITGGKRMLLFKDSSSAAAMFL